jgi:long-chain fatty acid transport protein
VAACLWLSLLIPAAVEGDGFRLIDHGAAATAQGAAFAAQADDPSAVHYNPAGMTQLPGFQMYSGISLISSTTHFTSPSGATSHGGSGGLLSPPPSRFFLTYGLGHLGLAALEGLTLGLGLTSTFGIATTYPDSGPLSQVATHGALPLLDIKPTAAYRLTPYLAIGAGLDIYTFASFVGDGHAEQKRRAGPEFAPLGIPTGARLEVNGTDTAVGFNLSALITPLRTGGKPRLNLGIVYRSPVTLDLSGDFLVNGTRAAGAAFQIELPWSLTGAVAGWIFRDDEREWKLEVDVDYVDWSSFKNLDVKLSNGVTLPFPQKWHSSYTVMIGTEYKWLGSLLPGWDVAARAGYVRSATPVPTGTFTAVVPDSDYNAFSVGLGFLCRTAGRWLGSLSPAAIGIDLAYQAFVHDSRTIASNVDPRVNGQWQTTTHVGSIGLRVNF